MSETKCKACGRKLIWGGMPGGKTIPLDAISPVYIQVADNEFERCRTAFVSHFATCPQANQFSGSRVKENK